LVIIGIAGLVISIPFILSPFLEEPLLPPVEPEEPTPTDEPTDTEPTLGYAIIRGAVTDAETGKPISAVTVRADTEYETTTGSEESDYFGVYYLKVPLGTYTVEASKLGYLTETSTVYAPEEKTYELDFTLTLEKCKLVIETIDQAGKGLDGDIFLDGQLVGKGYVELSKRTNTVLKASFGHIEGYVTPEEETFYIAPGTTVYEVKGIYLPLTRPPENVKLTVYVKVHSTTLKTEFPLEDAEVKVLGMVADTDSNGMAFFWVPANYGELRIEVCHEDYGSTAGKATIGEEDVETTIRFLTGGLIITPRPLHTLPFSTAPRATRIDHLTIGALINMVSIALILIGVRGWSK